jgi:hypothetical protein
LAAVGLAPSRSIRPHQRCKAGSFAREGENLFTGAASAPGLIDVVEKPGYCRLCREPGRKVRRSAIHHQRAAPVGVSRGEQRSQCHLPNSQAAPPAPYWFLELEQIAEQPSRTLGCDNRIRLGNALESSGEIRRLANDGLLLSRTNPN